MLYFSPPFQGPKGVGWWKAERAAARIVTGVARLGC